MRAISLIFLLTFGASAGTDYFGFGTVTLESGVTISIKSAIEPTVSKSAFLPLGTASGSDGNTMRFLMCDNTARSCLGFRLEVSSPDSSGERTATFGPIGPEGAKMSLRITGEPSFKQAPLAKYPPPQKIREGDAMALDLMVSADGKERVVEYLQFSRVSSPAAHDFTLDDGPIAVLPQPWVGASVNGAEMPVASNIREGSRGSTLWAYFPRSGRFILSLVPHEGFVRAGEMRGERISFRANGQRYEVVLGKPPVSGEGPWNVYVMQQPYFVPSPPARFAQIGVDRLENLLSRR